MPTPSTQVLTMLGRKGESAAHRASDRATARLRAHWRGYPLVVEEQLFSHVILQERRRADRFEQAFALVLIAPTGRSAAPPDWKPVVEALGQCSRDIDVMGWLEGGTVLGVLMPDADASRDSFVRGVESRVQAALATHLDVEERGAFRIRLCHHSGRQTAPARGPADADTLLEMLPRSRTARVRAVLKRILDIVGSLALLVALAPLFGLIAAAVKLTSPGPVFFRQPRLGQGGAPFTILKFRTMRADCDPAVHEAFVSQFIKAGKPVGGSEAMDAPFKIADDPRVTPLGRLLRRTSMDELPQFWNVLRGQMSLVGPRPPLSYEVEQYEPWHYRRVLEAKPGITGLWQVNGRSRTTFDDMVRLDLRYAKRSSAWMDLKILLATPRAVVSGKGAR